MTKTDKLMHEHHSAVREEYKAQLRQIIWSAYSYHNMGSLEQKGIFREVIGEVMELEDRNKTAAERNEQKNE